MATEGMSAADMLAVLTGDMGLTMQEIAESTGVGLKTVQGWGRGAKPHRRSYQNLMKVLQVHGWLSAAFKTWPDARAWLRQNNPHLGQLKPVEVIRIGKTDRLAGALTIQTGGVYF